MEDFFFPNLGGDLRSDAHQSQMIGGDEDVDHTKIIGGDTFKLQVLEDISPPSPRVSAPVPPVIYAGKQRSAITPDWPDAFLCLKIARAFSKTCKV